MATRSKPQAGVYTLDVGEFVKCWEAFWANPVEALDSAFVKVKPTKKKRKGK